MKQRFEAITGFTLLGALALLLSVTVVSDARAAELVDIRIGIHEGYTRLVFELDQPAEFEVEESEGKQEIVVILEAESIPENLKASLDAKALVRSLKSEGSLVGSLQIEPLAEESRVRIQLIRDGLKLRRMQLPNPPRVVLDVVVP